MIAFMLRQVVSVCAKMLFDTVGACKAFLTDWTRVTAVFFLEFPFALLVFGSTIICNFRLDYFSFFGGFHYFSDSFLDNNRSHNFWFLDSNVFYWNVYLFL